MNDSSSSPERGCLLFTFYKFSWEMFESNYSHQQPWLKSRKAGLFNISLTTDLGEGNSELKIVLIGLKFDLLLYLTQNGFLG